VPKVGTEPDTNTLTINLKNLLSTRGTVRLPNGGNNAWRRVTEASIEEYRLHHQGENYPDSTLAIMSMFESFIGKWAKLWGASNMIDVGCGIGRKLPPYVRHLSSSIAYVGLDPLEENAEREYAFINGRLEDLSAKGLDQNFDMAVFATSLDHFEDAEAALDLVAQIVEGQKALIWCGLHDAPLIAQNDLAIAAYNICSKHTSVISRVLGFTAFFALRWPRIAWALMRREQNLSAGRPLDQLHFHYFTETSLRALLEEVGELHEFVLCPGTNSAFAAVTIRRTSE